MQTKEFYELQERAELYEEALEENHERIAELETQLAKVEAERDAARAELANYRRTLQIGDVVILDIPTADLKANPAKAHANLDIYIVTNTDAEEVEIMKLGGGYGTWALAKWCVLVNPATELRAADPKDFSQNLRIKWRGLHTALSEARARIAELEKVCPDCQHLLSAHRLDYFEQGILICMWTHCTCARLADAGKEGNNV